MTVGNLTINNATIGSGTVNASTVTSTTTMSASGNAYMTIATLTDGATITPNFGANNNFTVTLGGNRTLANATNLTAGADEFELYTAGSNAEDIAVTTASLVKLINANSALVYAYPLSTGEADQPGRILLESRTLANVPFTVVSSVSTCWVPVLKSTADVNQTSTNDQFLNGLMFSKQGQGEAVPTKNIFFVGRGDSRILRIIALRDGLVIQKEYDGHWILRGDNEASFSIAPLDLTANLIALDTSVSVNNVIYALCEAGLAQVTDSAVSYISLPIKDI